MKTGLPTTVIGSFPKPDYLPIRDWFDSARDTGEMDSPEATRSYSAYRPSDADEALFVRAAEDIIALQIAAGIDLPTDGEVRRENYIHYHCRHVGGFDFDHLEHRVLRTGPMRPICRPFVRRFAMKTRPTARMILPPARRSVPGRSNSPFPGR